MGARISRGRFDISEYELRSECEVYNLCKKGGMQTFALH